MGEVPINPSSRRLKWLIVALVGGLPLCYLADVFFGLPIWLVLLVVYGAIALAYANSSQHFILIKWTSIAVWALTIFIGGFFLLFVIACERGGCP